MQGKLYTLNTQNDTVIESKSNVIMFQVKLYTSAEVIPFLTFSKGTTTEIIF
jgi:hypothetical protein